ncbi:GTP 3',8-cyclase [subsurface metagenome]
MIILGLCILTIPVFLQKPQAAPAQEVLIENASTLKEALFYEKLYDNEVECRLCPRRCLLKEGERGDCQVRENIGGVLYSLVYGKPCSLSVEPIEKAPLFHFMPGHTRLCLATVGCNLRCKYCQNWQISQKTVEEVEHIIMSPEQVVETALHYNVDSICFTFSEPVVFYEYLYDIAVLAREKGLKTSIVSNGYINPEPLKKLLKVLDAVKIDLKAFTEEFYEEVSLGELAPVLDSLRIIKQEGVWLEVLNLVVPTLNDDPEEIRAMCAWIREELGDDVPLHFSRFFPQYRLTSLPSTPVETLEKAYAAAKEAGLKYVYIGNVPGHKYNSTFCPSCGETLIARIQFSVSQNQVTQGRCPFCGEPIPGFW